MADEKWDSTWDSVVSSLRHAAIACRDLADKEWERRGERDELADNIAKAIEGWLDLIDERRRGPER